MRIAPRSSRPAIISCRALTASAAEAASADSSNGPEIRSVKPVEALQRQSHWYLVGSER